jgi:hypothetical protein
LRRGHGVSSAFGLESWSPNRQNIVERSLVGV